MRQEDSWLCCARLLAGPTATKGASSALVSDNRCLVTIWQRLWEQLPTDRPVPTCLAS
jgi:hypothetical protein